MSTESLLLEKAKLRLHFHHLLFPYRKPIANMALYVYTQRVYVCDIPLLNVVTGLPFWTFEGAFKIIDKSN